MIEIKTKGHKIKLFENHKELPIFNYFELIKLGMEDAHVGSDMKSFGQRNQQLYNFLTNKKFDEAIQESINMNNTFYYAINKINITSFCFLCYVHSIDGKTFNDYSFKGLKEGVEKIKNIGLKYSQVEDIVEDLKKKLMEILNPIGLIGSRTTESSILLINTSKK